MVLNLTNMASIAAFVRCAGKQAKMGTTSTASHD